MKIDEIKELLKSGDVAGAESAAQKLLAAEPDNVQALMFYGTCRQLQGDEATFRRIRDELAPKMETVADGETQGLWRKFDGMSKELGVLRTRACRRAEILRIKSGQRHLYGCPGYYGKRGFGCLLIIICMLIYGAWRLCIK